MEDFKVGDRIEMTSESGHAEKGMTGTIVAFLKLFNSVGVKFDKRFYGGHDLDGECEDGYGQWVMPNKMKLLREGFKVGQIYRVGTIDHRNGNIVRIVSVNNGRFSYKTIRGEDGLANADAHSDFAISLTLLHGSEIGEAIKAFDSEKSETSVVREVKRPAKVGEYIKIVNAHDNADAYDNGDILKVCAEFNTCGVYAYTKKNYPCHRDDIAEPNGYISSHEYVVLEGYKPKQEAKIHRKAKVGDTVKIIHDSGCLCHNHAVGDYVFVDGTVERPGEDGFIWGTGLNPDNYVVISSKHSYAESEIAEAKKFVLDTIREQAEKDNIVILIHDNMLHDEPNNTGFFAYIVQHEDGSDPYDNGVSFRSNAYRSKCSPDDEPNEWIGKCVALCKALHKPIPRWIMAGD